MTKKLVLILLGAAFAIGVLGAAGYVYAQVEDPPEGDPSVETGDERPPGFKRGRGGGWFGFGLGEGPLGEYLFQEIAAVFDLSDEQVAAFEAVKETMMNIKDSYTLDEVREKMKTARTAAIDAALADEAITQEEADRMLEHMQHLEEGGFGRFGGPGRRGGFPGRDFLPPRDGGVMGEYLEAALADALDLSVEEFQALKAEEGFNLHDYAIEQDMTVEALEDWIQEIHTSAINAALEAGAITQEQADQMLEHLEESGGRMPFGPKFPGRGRGW